MRELKLGNGKRYRFNTVLFQVMVLVLLFIVVGVLAWSGFDKNQYLYVSCPVGEVKCFNPLYENFDFCGKTISGFDPICTEEFVPEGFEWGRKPPMILGVFPWVVVGLLVVCFVLNHFLYNRGVKVKELRIDIDETGSVDSVDEDRGKRD
jgi:uncharacterized integral membrane protein